MSWFSASTRRRQSIRWAVGVIPALLALLVGEAWGETVRIAVVVGHNNGGAGERPLRYAEDDAAKLADVLVELGDVDKSRLFLLRGKPREAVVEALGRAAAVVKTSRRSPEDRVILTFFFSGHSNAGALQLGATRLGYGELKRLLDGSGAEVRLTIVDGCKSGGLVATKGGKPGPAFEIGLADQLSSVGEATLTSSAADEASLESSEIRGSFFTHHLVSGLRGAADSSGDGRVTLSEAYEYAFNRTVVASATTGSTPQHPNYEYQLSGGGELVLTRVGARTASLRLPEGFTRALVINVLRDQVIAELTRDEVRVLAVAPGEYAVRLWKASSTYAGRVKAPANATTEVKWEQLAAPSTPPVASKGAGAETVAGAIFDGSDRFGQATDPPLSPEAQVLYDEQVLSVGDSLIVTARDDNAHIAKSNDLYVGRYRKKLKADEFLRRAGRPDLAREVAARRTTRITIAVVGGAIMLGSFLYGVAGERCDPPLGDPDFGPCIDRHGDALKLGLVGGVVGFAVLGGAYVMSDKVPEAHVLRQLADDHNRGLRERLRAPGGTASKPPPITASLRLAPVAGPSGGGLVLSGQF